MRKYFNIVCISLQSMLVYRTNFLVRATAGLVPLIATVSLWRAIYAGGKEVIGGYTLAQMISYYVIATVVDALTAVTEDDWQVANEIRDGQISQILLKPIDYLSYRLCLFFSGRMIYTVSAVVPVAIFVLLHSNYLVAPASPVAFVAFVLSVMMSALLQFLLCYTVALLAFWVLEISAFAFILLAMERLASGQMFPLDILPDGVGSMMKLLPFAYQSYFPVAIYLGRIEGREMLEGFLIQGFWVGVLYFGARWVWGRGLRSYAAVGG